MFNSYRYHINKARKDLIANISRQKKFKDYIKNHDVRKLQLGSASLGFKDWLNTDLYDRDNEILALDVTKRFPFKTGTIDYIFSEHLIEHLTFEQGQSMLKECFRVLKPGGKIRTATPKLEFLIHLYTSKKKSPLQKKYIKWAIDDAYKGLKIYEDSFIINNFVRAWGHLFIYDIKTLQLALKRVGFKNITLHKPGESRDVHLRNLESHGTMISKEFNNMETMVLEAMKPKNA